MRDADIVLHVESFDKEQMKLVRLSFSTKITDYFSAGKCIFAVGNADLAPMQYFQDADAAVTVENEQDIEKGVQSLLNRENLIAYAKNAVECGLKNHSAEHIHQTFDAVISRVYKGK